MKRILLTLVFLLAAASANATQYYMATTGNDSNNGTSVGTPWLSPNHAINCGDIISAAVGNYNETSFQFGAWGTVTGSGHCAAFVICATFDACKVSSTNQPAVWVTASHWAILGFEATESGNNYGCFQMTGTLVDVIFANDIANGCYGGGFTPSASDYEIFIADIAYNAAQDSGACKSGFPINTPANSDTLPGTHIFISQTFAWGNVDPSPCAGGAPTDGEGIILDTFSANSYTGQTVLENNLSIFNGSNGFEVYSNTSAPVYLVNNTAYGNNTDTAQVTGLCGAFAVGGGGTKTEVRSNIFQSPTTYSCGGNNVYAMTVQGATTFSNVFNNWAIGASGQNANVISGGGFSYGSNTLGTSPAFTSPPGAAPAAPNCSGKINVIDCMAPIIADFVPTVSGTSGNGYQKVKSTSVFDPFFPSWLCQYSAQLAGLVTMGCTTGSFFSGTTTGSIH